MNSLSEPGGISQLQSFCNNRQNESGGETSYITNMMEVHEKLPDRKGGLYIEESYGQCGPEELQNNKVAERLSQKPFEENMSEYV